VSCIFSQVDAKVISQSTVNSLLARTEFSAVRSECFMSAVVLSVNYSWSVFDRNVSPAPYSSSSFKLFIVIAADVIRYPVVGVICQSFNY